MSFMGDGFDNNDYTGPNEDYRGPQLPADQYPGPQDPLFPDSNYGGDTGFLGDDGNQHFTTGTDESAGPTVGPNPGLPSRDTTTPDGGPIIQGGAGSPGLSNTGADSWLRQFLKGLTADAGPGGGGQNPLGSVLSGAAKAAQDANQVNDRNQVARSSVQNQANVNAVTLPDKRLKSSILASVMGNYSPATVNWGGPGSGMKGQVPTYGGGVQGGLQNLDPKTKALVQQVISDQLLSQMQGGSSAPGGGTDRYVTPVGESSTMDKVLGGTSFGVSLLRALQQQGILGGKSSSGQPAAIA